MRRQQLSLGFGFLLALAGILALAWWLLSSSDETPKGAIVDSTGVTDPRSERTYTGWGSLRGRVRFVGEPIPDQPLIDVRTNPHAQHCQSPDLRDETWVVNRQSRAIANVVVWLEPPNRTYFPAQPSAQRTWPREVVIEQPKCKFVPHVTILYPETYDPKAQRRVPTGQRFRVLNNSSIVHEAAFSGSRPENQVKKMLPPEAAGGRPSEQVFRLKVDRQPIPLRCGLHRWMNAYVWAFEHPYAAVSDAEGNFHIPCAPAGAAVRLRAWHEAGAVTIPKKVQEVTLQPDQEQVIELTVRRRK